MLRLSLYVLLVTCTVSVLSETKLINNEMDMNLLKYNEEAKRLGLITMPIVDIAVEGFSIKNSRIGIMYGIKRESDVYKETGDDALTFTGQFSMEPFIIVAGELKYLGHESAVNITANKVTADIAFTSSKLSQFNDCRTTWTKFNVLPIDKMVLHSNDPFFNNKIITEDVNNNILPKLNNMFMNEQFIKILNERFDFCEIIQGRRKLW